MVNKCNAKHHYSQIIQTYVVWKYSKYPFDRPIERSILNISDDKKQFDKIRITFAL
jgi:hypothetical protein